MPIPRIATQEFFIESKEREFLNPGEDDLPHDFNVLSMLFRLFSSVSRNRNNPLRDGFISYTIIEIASAQPTNGSTLLLVENRITHSRPNHDFSHERSSNDTSLHLSTAIDHDREDNLLF